MRVGDMSCVVCRVMDFTSASQFNCTFAFNRVVEFPAFHVRSPCSVNMWERVFRDCHNTLGRQVQRCQLFFSHPHRSPGPSANATSLECLSHILSHPLPFVLLSTHTHTHTHMSHHTHTHTHTHVHVPVFSLHLHTLTHTRLTERAGHRQKQVVDVDSCILLQRM